MPSVRELAGNLSVNPATVAKAYQKLTDSGILTVKRGEGTYVTEKPPSLPKNERVKTLRDGATRYASLAVTVGANEREASRELGAVWKEFGEGTGRVVS